MGTTLVFVNMSSCDTENEMFDIFNEKNEKIGRELRSKVHKLGLWHRSCHILVFNSKQQILLQKRSPKKDICPSFWDLSCAEHLQENESFINAAVRGLKEELNISKTIHDLQSTRDVIQLKFEKDSTKDFEFNQCFICFSDEFQIDEEVCDAQWMDFETLCKKINTTNNNNNNIDDD